MPAPLRNHVQVRENSRVGRGGTPGEKAWMSLVSTEQVFPGTLGVFSISEPKSELSDVDCMCIDCISSVIALRVKMTCWSSKSETIALHLRGRKTPEDGTSLLPGTRAAFSFRERENDIWKGCIL